MLASPITTDHKTADGMLDDLRAAVRERPGDAKALFRLGVACLRAGLVDEARARLRRAAQLSPADPEPRFALANALEATGQTDQARAAYRACLESDPGHLPARLGLGALLARSGALAAAAEEFAAAAAAHPSEPAAWRNLAQASALLGRPEPAAEAWRRVAETAPGDPEAHNQLGLALMQSDRPEEAAAAWRRALELAPQRAGYHSNLGNALLNLGRLEEARRCYQLAVELDPALAAAFFQWARGARHRLAHPAEMDGVEAVLQRPDLDADDRAFFHFALGKIYDDSGLYDLAWPHFAAGNRLEAVRQPFEATAHAAHVDELIGYFSAGRLADRGLGTHDPRPVFIVGLPRSGTTLVEQILASHPEVHGAGEREDLGRIEAGLSGRTPSGTPYPVCLDDLGPGPARELARRYLEGVCARAGDAVRVTDKMPHNFLRLGLAALLLPAARVIHCRRAPRDTCLSIFFQKFSGANPYAYDLNRIAAFHRDYRRLMEHWRAALPLAMLEVRYEDLVADQEAQTRRLLDFCGLAWRDECLSFFRARRSVATSSSWQVRQPVYRSSLARWRNYEKHLTPLLEALTSD